MANIPIPQFASAEITNISVGANNTQLTSSYDNLGISSNLINFEFDETVYVEYSVYTANLNLYEISYTYNSYFLQDNAISNIEVDNITIYPERDLGTIFQISQGNWIVNYNILKNKCGSSFSKLFNITEISPSRTEVRLDSEYINDFTLASETLDFINEIETSNYFKDFYLNFGKNRLLGCINIALDTTSNNTQIIIKLSDPLPNNFTVGSQASVVEKVAETITYSVNFPEPETTIEDNTELLPGPNLNLVLKDEFSIGTDFQTLNSLTNVQESSSFDRLQNVLSSSGININVDFTNFENFIHFSDATMRLENFHYKMSLLESYSSSLNTQTQISNNTTNIQIFEDKIREIIANFDRYENFLYYESGSFSWPKTNNTIPYRNATTGSIQLKEWLGSFNETSQYFGGILLSASNYDNTNNNNLLFSIPEFIRMDSENAEFEKFIGMLGQYYDDIWLYTKDITNKLDADNRINFGISRDIVADALRDFGYKIYNNNYSSADLYNAFFGFDGSSIGGLTNVSIGFPLFYNLALYGGGIYNVVPSGSQVITNFISASNDIIPLDDINKRVYKRIYHNHPFLVKSKGTKASIRTLSSAYGVPDSLLQIYEFGGKDKSNTNDWDFYKKIYNKSLTIQNNKDGIFTDFSPTSSFGIDHGLNSAWGINPLVPRTIEYRFKSNLDPNTLPFEPNIRQSTFVLQPNLESLSSPVTSSVSIVLEYNGSGSASGSFLGSTTDPLNQHADLTLYIKGASQYYSSSINLPFLNQDWWNVMLHYDSGSNKFELYTGNKIYHGDNGTKLGFTGSTSITVPSYNDTLNYRTGIRGLLGKSNTVTLFATGITGSSQFSGSIQEVRYWSNLLSESFWHNHIMNPLSIENGVLTGSDSPVESLMFRSREGEDYSLTGTAGAQQNLNSIHPKATGSFIPTSSFTSGNLFTAQGAFNNNTETQFLNQPIIGIKNRVSDRVRVENLEIPQGDVLSCHRRIQQNSNVSKSYTEGINYIEAGFSPTNEINDDIMNQLGSWDISQFIGDPRNTYDRKNNYPDIDKIRDEYFQKYIKNYDLVDYIKLIKNFDNSLFKMIKDLIPVRNSAATGIIVKQHLLERQKYPEPLMSFSDVTLTGSIKSQPRGFITGSPIQVFSGGTGGLFDEFNGTSNRFNITQSYSQSIPITNGRTLNIVHDNQEEFYNGELSGSIINITTQSLNPGCEQYLNIFVTPPEVSNFDTYVYNYPSISSFNQFNHPKTVPSSGEIYLAKSSNNKITKIKVSRFDKSGKDLFAILNPATRFSFELEGVQYGINVTLTNALPNAFEYTTNNPTVPLTENNFKNINAEASGGSGSRTVSSGIPFGGSKNETIPIGSYTSETDPQSLFNITTGEYISPHTPNRALHLTASFDFTASYLAASDAGVATQIRLSLDGLQFTSGPSVQRAFLISGDSQVISGSLNLSGSLNYGGSFSQTVNQFIVKGEPIKLIANVIHPNESLTAIGNYEFNNANLKFVTSSVTDNNPIASLKSYEPYVGEFGYEYQGFLHDFDCQPLLNNAVEIRKSSLFLDVDYTTGTILPVNISNILQNVGVKAEIPDSNYTSKTWSNIRYNGVKLQAAKLNVFTPPNTFILSDGTIWEGDKSFGNDPVLEQLYPKFGYFKLLVPTSPELENATQVKLEYLIDQDGEVNKPLLNSPAFFNVEGTYETNNIVDISLDDSFQTDGGNFPTNEAAGINLDNFNTNANVIRGARRIDPILTTQVASIFDPDFNNVFSQSLTFINPVGIDTNFSFQAGEFFNKEYNSSTGTNEFIISASNEGYDPAGLYTNTTSTWQNTTGQQFSLTPIRYRLQLNVLGESTTNANIMIRLVKPNGQETILAQRFVAQNTPTIFNDDSFAAGDPIALPDIVTEYIFPEVNDKVRVQLTLFGGPVPPDGTGGKVLVSNVNFYGEPEQLPEVEISGSFWRTGSLFPNSTALTSSEELAQYYNTTKQVEYKGTTFKPINEKFTILPGDQLRFMGSEQNVHTVKDISVINAGNEAGKLLVNILPPIPTGVNLNQFLLRRFNEDGTSVIIDLDPPNTGFGTTRGIIKNTSNNNQIENNTNEIISTLIQNGTIS